MQICENFHRSAKFFATSKYEGYSKSNAPNFTMYKQIIVATCIIIIKRKVQV